MRGLKKELQIFGDRVGQIGPAIEEGGGEKYRD